MSIPQLDINQINLLTRDIIGAAIEVHKFLGPGLLESTYEECLCHELYSRQINFERQLPIPVVYKNIRLDCGYRLDLLVERAIVIEVKAVDQLMPIHKAQLLSYLKLGGWRTGLIINFNVNLLKSGIRRLMVGYDN